MIVSNDTKEKVDYVCKTYRYVLKEGSIIELSVWSWMCIVTTTHLHKYNQQEATLWLFYCDGSFIVIDEQYASRIIEYLSKGLK